MCKIQDLATSDVSFVIWKVYSKVGLKVKCQCIFVTKKPYTKLNNYFPFHKLIDGFWGSLPQYWLSPNLKTTFQSNTLMLLKLCTHKVWHYAYGNMHSTCVGFHSLTYATFFICFDNDKELQVCYGWTSHLYPFDTFVETIDIFPNCWHKM